MNVNVMFHNKCLGDVALTSPLTYKAKLSFYILLYIAHIQATAMLKGCESLQKHFSMLLCSC